MSLETPTTQQIADDIVAYLQISLNQSLRLLPKSFVNVLAKALAGVFIILYKYGGWIFLQQYVSTAANADSEINGVTINPLVEWGRLVGVGDPTAATQAELTATITVENQTGSLPVGSQLVSTANGYTYLTIQEILLDAPTKTVTIRAASDQAGNGGTGTDGNLALGATVSFANPLANVARTATITGVVTTAANAESTAVYRQRVLDRFQKPPQGGALADYELWGEEVAGIINVYPYTGALPGTVDVYAEATVASSGSEDGIPTAAQLLAVEESIQYYDNGLANRRPANAFVTVYPITRSAFDVQVFGIQVSDEATTVEAIDAALTEYFLSREPFITGLSIPPRVDLITATAVAGVIEDIVTGVGGVFTGATLSYSGNVINQYILNPGQKAKLGTLTT